MTLSPTYTVIVLDDTPGVQSPFDSHEIVTLSPPLILVIALDDPFGVQPTSFDSHGGRNTLPHLFLSSPSMILFFVRLADCPATHFPAHPRTIHFGWFLGGRSFAAYLRPTQGLGRNVPPPDPGSPLGLFALGSSSFARPFLSPGLLTN